MKAGLIKAIQHISNRLSVSGQVMIEGFRKDAEVNPAWL